MQLCETDPAPAPAADPVLPELIHSVIGLPTDYHPPTDSMAAVSWPRTCREPRCGYQSAAEKGATICHRIWSPSKAWAAPREAHDSDSVRV